MSSKGMEIGSNRDIIKDRKKLAVVKPDVPAGQHELPHNLKMLTEKHNDQKLAITILIVAAGLIAYHFW